VGVLDLISGSVWDGTIESATLVRKIQFQDCSTKVPEGTVECTQVCHTL
jgi:hypothetical protein